MSIDLIVGERHTPSRTWNRASVEAAMEGLDRRTPVDLLIVLGGWGQSEGGDNGADKLVKKLEAVRSASGNTVLLRAWRGQLRATVSEADDFVRSHFHPLGKLVLCGHGVGGFNAMSLAGGLETTGYYNVNKRSFTSYYHASMNTENDVMGIARVDLLVTIDAAQGPTTSSRTIAPSVRKNVNVYQNVPSRPLSHGAPNTALDDSATRVENHDWTSRYAAAPRDGHGRIDEDSVDFVVAAVRDELGR